MTTTGEQEAEAGHVVGTAGADLTYGYLEPVGLLGGRRALSVQPSLAELAGGQFPHIPAQGFGKASSFHRLALPEQNGFAGC